MKKNGKIKGVSRRDFLKGLGAGAVGTAVISAGLLKPDRAESTSARQKIPFSRRSPDIENHLKSVLGDIKRVAASALVLWVSCRLNRTGAKKPAPVFVGWVEDDVPDGARVIRRGRGYPNPPIVTHFGGTHLSQLYQECFKARVGEVVKKHWNGDKASPGSLELGRKYYEETHRRSIPIRIDKNYVGTLNVGFRGDPTPADGQITPVLARWAQADSDLVQYIRDNLTVGGLPHP